MACAGESPAPIVVEGQASVINNWYAGMCFKAVPTGFLSFPPGTGIALRRIIMLLIMPLGQRTAGEASAPGDSIPLEDDVTEDL